MPNIFSFKSTVSTFAALVAFSCSVSAASPADKPDELSRLMSLKSEVPQSAKGGNSLRQSELDLTAVSVGSSAGLKWRYDEIMETVLEPNAKHLDRIFDFSRFMADGKIYLPAVRIAKDDILFGEERQTMVRVSYTISEEAMLRSAAPDFRDYLYRDFPSSADPHWKLLPENSSEVGIWKTKIQEGFEMGVVQANDMYQDHLAEMRSDYLDRQNFLNLVAKNMLSQPSINTQKKGITFNGRTMNVGEVVYEINGSADYIDESNWTSAWKK